jgi:hypothetical protein
MKIIALLVVITSMIPMTEMVEMRIQIRTTMKKVLEIEDVLHKVVEYPRMTHPLTYLGCLGCHLPQAIENLWAQSRKCILAMTLLNAR